MKSVIIDRLIQIEENARNISKDINGREMELPVIIQEECARIEKELKAEYEKRSAEIRETKEKECRKKMDELESDSVVRLKKLDEYFNQNHVSWEDSIFNSIIGR